MPTAWDVVFVISVFGGAAMGIWFFQERIRQGWQHVVARFEPDLVEEMFSPEADIGVVTDEEFERNIKERADQAVERIDRISVHMYTVDRIEERALRNPSIKHRILLLKPTYSGASGANTGFELIRKGYFEENVDLSNPSKFEEKYSSIHCNLIEGKWKNVEVKLYETSPWLRGAFIDGLCGGFIVVPTMYGGREAAKFWTEDVKVVESLETIFEDIWTDPRTEDFVTWYENNDTSKVATP